MIKLRKAPFLLAAASGSLLFLSSPGAAELWPLAWIALVPLMLVLPGESPARAARLGLAAGLFYFVPLLYWILIVLAVYGHLAWWLSIPALLLLSLYMALYTAVFTAGCSWALRRGLPLLWVAPPLWVALDFIRGRLLSGFPWQDLAYSQYKAALLIQTADLAGHHGVTFYIVLVNCLVAAILTYRGAGKSEPGPGRFSAVLPAVLLIIMAAVYTPLRYRQIAELTGSSATAELAVVQGNIPQELKWTPEMQRETLTIYKELSERALRESNSGQQKPLLVWPETALPFYAQSSPLFSELVEGLVKKRGCWLLTGAPYYESAPAVGARYYNSAILVSPQGEISARYDKQHLVPFGEYIPFRRLLGLDELLGPLVESVGDFSPGQLTEPLAGQGARVGVLICFESIFPELARKWVDGGANLLVNITNDAWFGRSSAPWQHFSMAVFRAVETRRSLARAANTGISGFVDPLGRLLERSALFRPCYLRAELPLLTIETFYVRYGHWFPLFCLFAVAVVFAWAAYVERGRN